MKCSNLSWSCRLMTAISDKKPKRREYANRIDENAIGTNLLKLLFRMSCEIRGGVRLRQSSQAFVWWNSFGRYYIIVSLPPPGFWFNTFQIRNRTAGLNHLLSKSPFNSSDPKHIRLALVMSFHAAQEESLPNVVARGSDREVASNNAVKPFEDEGNDKVRPMPFMHPSWLLLKLARAN